MYSPHTQWVNKGSPPVEASHQEVAQSTWPGVTAHQAGHLFVAGVICLTYCLADSDLTILQLEMDPDNVEEVSIDLLDRDIPSVFISLVTLVVVIVFGQLWNIIIKLRMFCVLVRVHLDV